MSQRDTRGAGMVYFAAIMMIVIGVFGAIEGLAAIIKNEFFVVTPNYFITVDASAWGWIHLLLGIIVALAGFALMGGATWARVVGMAVAGLSLLANFLFIPHYPVWSILIIALDVLIIWALVTYPSRAGV